MSYLAQFIELLCCIAMFYSSRSQKLAILFFVMICMSAVTVSYIPFGGSLYLVSNCFLLSEIKNIRENLKEILTLKIGNMYLLLFLGGFLALLHSPHYQTVIQWLRFFIIEFSGKYLALVYALWCLTKEKDIKNIVNSICASTLILTFWGVLNFITKKSIWILSVFNSGNDYRTNDVLSVADGTGTMLRSRVMAMFTSSFNYGYMCIILLILSILFYTQKYISVRKAILLIICSTFGIFVCGSRTVLLSAIAGGSVYILLRYSLKKWMKYFMITFLIFIIGIQFVPSLSEKISFFADAFSTSQDLRGATGSSLGMRSLQLAAVQRYLIGKEFFGNGIDFFNFDLGWADGTTRSIDSDIWGLEGIHLNLLLERGYVGFIIWVTFMILLGVKIMSLRLYDKISVSLAMGVFTSYITFAFLTGELGSAYPSFLVMGFIIKYIYIKKRYGKNKIFYSNTSL